MPSAAVAAAVRRQLDLACDHILVQLRADSLEGVPAFVPMTDVLRAVTGYAAPARRTSVTGTKAGTPSSESARSWTRMWSQPRSN